MNVPHRDGQGRPSHDLAKRPCINVRSETSREDDEDLANEKLRLTAMRILSKAFISEKIEVDKPTGLRIRGLDDGIRRKLGDEEYERVGGTE